MKMAVSEAGVSNLEKKTRSRKRIAREMAPRRPCAGDARFLLIMVVPDVIELN
jgi:hypothetical protein